MLELYQNIKKRRKQLGMTQEDLAKKTGYNNRSAIAKIESGLIDLPQSKISEFAKALEIPISDLMGYEIDYVAEVPDFEKYSLLLIDATQNLTSKQIINLLYFLKVLNTNLSKETLKAIDEYIKYLENN